VDGTQEPDRAGAGLAAHAAATGLQRRFSSVTIGGERWRVFSVSDSTGEVSVQVAMRHSVIDEEIRHKTFGALGLTTLLLAIAGLLMWFAVGKSLAAPDGAGGHGAQPPQIRPDAAAGGAVAQ
jgi:hypothetical protein